MACLLAACRNDPRASLPQSGSFGKKLENYQAYTVTEVLLDQPAIAAAGKEIQVTGNIEKYCKGEGCWLTLSNPEGKALRCEIENKSFALPRNIDGKTAIVQGHLVIDSTGTARVPVMLVNGLVIQ